MMALNILVKAKGLIEQDGWIQGDPGRPEWGWCARGAVQRATQLYPDSTTEDYVTALDALQKVVGNTITVWNDVPRRTKGEVLTAFGAAITFVRRNSIG